MKALHRKVKDGRGASLAEVLMVILIMLLAGSVVVAGIPAAVRAYEKVVDGANAQLLLSTTVSSLRRELGLANAVKTGGGNAVQTYTNGETGYQITLGNGAEGITRSWAGQDPLLLVTEKAATKNMVTSYESITYADGVFSIAKLKVTKNGKVLAELEQPLKIRAVMGMKASAAA